MSTPQTRLAALNLVLPQPAAPVANYVPYVISGNQVFISGQVAVSADGKFSTGQLGAGLTVEQGQHAALLCGLNLIAHLKNACGGDLSKVKRVIKLGGFVNAAPSSDGADVPKIINGCSDLFVDVFGDVGKHARFAVGVSALPFDVAVEIDAIVEIDN